MTHEVLKVAVKIWLDEFIILKKNKLVLPLKITHREFGDEAHYTQGVVEEVSMLHIFKYLIITLPFLATVSLVLKSRASLTRCG